MSREKTTLQGYLDFVSSETGAGANEAGELVQLCTFHVGDESYVIDIMRIREIINPLPVTPLRRSSPLVEGVIDLREEVIPLVDLRRLLGVRIDASVGSTKHVITRVESRVVGLVVDSVGRVIIVPRSDIKPLPTLDSRRGRVLPGVINHQGRLYLLLNIKALLNEEGISSGALSDLHSNALARGTDVDE